MPGWKFVTNHALVLCLIAQQPRITAREISMTIGITEKTTRSIISDLETDGYVAKKRKADASGTWPILLFLFERRYSRTKLWVTFWSSLAGKGDGSERAVKKLVILVAIPVFRSERLIKMIFFHANSTRLRVPAYSCQSLSGLRESFC